MSLIDNFSYLLEAENLTAGDIPHLMHLMKQNAFFDGLLNNIGVIGKEDVFSASCSNPYNSMGKIDRSEVEETMHVLAVTFPNAEFHLFAENLDNPREQYRIVTCGDLYQEAELQYHMPELSAPVPFEARHSQPLQNKDFLQEFLTNTNFDLLYQQKMELLKVLDLQSAGLGPCQFSTETLEGLVNFLDFIGDWAEQEGRFTYPPEEDQTIDSIMGVVRAQLNTAGRVEYPLLDGFSIRVSVLEGSPKCMNPGKEFYWVALLQQEAGEPQSRFAGGADYRDYETVRELCEEALERYERLRARKKPPLNQQISGADDRKPPAKPGSPRKDHGIT